MKAKVTISDKDFDAVIFDMDGVVTQTAKVHAAAWKQLFDEYFQERARRGETLVPLFDIDADYRLYVDGKPRYDGVYSFLSSRGISLPWGSPADSPEAETICGLGNRKDGYFQKRLEKDGAHPYGSTLDLIRELKARNIRTGIFSASRNAEAVLTSAGVLAMFDSKVDGLDAERLGLRGKPEPGMLLELTNRLEAHPSRTAVMEDAIAGVRAGRAGGFRLVIGVDRSSSPGVLMDNGADIEVSDLSEVIVGD